MSEDASVSWFRDKFEAIRSQIQKAMIGQEDIVDGVLIGLAANGHVLLEGMPGLGKTLLVRSLAESLSLNYGRIQFTPDLMPADVTGTNVLAEAGGERRFEFRKGPIFANILLADEINRATPKTQSAMLEAMQERAVTVGGKRYQLDEPFLVMATQNPIEQEGTYPLPEAQLDRFFTKLLVPYPTEAELKRIVLITTTGTPPTVEPVASAEDVAKMRSVAREVLIADNVLDFALSIIVATHVETINAPEVTKRYVRYGSSPRGAQAIVSAARVLAILEGRYNVSKNDLIKAALPTLRHRILLNFEAEADGITPDQVISRIVEHVVNKDRDPIKV